MKLVAFIPLLPLVGAILLALFGRRLAERVVAAIACAAIGISFLISTVATVEYARERWVPDENRPYVSTEAGDAFPHSFVWIPGGSAVRTMGDAAGAPVVDGFLIRWSYHLDALSAVMVLCVTGVGFLIHVFAVGYMRGIASYSRCFASLNLLAFAMLVLVLGSNLAVTFVGWEVVGLCSYLLAGFYTDREEAWSAAKNAFIANRIGDVGFLMGAFGLFSLAGSLEYGDLAVFFASGSAGSEAFGQVGAIGLIALALFVAVTGKSAQIPLFVWLPDSMVAPTPVSAFIHSATMVTAGIYLLARLWFVFVSSATVLAVIAVVGGATALVAAAIAVSENDIKKVLAYSTVSQLGLCVLACGAGAFGAAMFHALTHAVSKAVLLLGAGSVVRALHHEQDLRRMGGLRPSLPRTHAAMVAGWLALGGILPFAGFFSQEALLARVYAAYGLPQAMRIGLWMVGLGVVFLTAFYATRLMALTFWGDRRSVGDVEASAETRESPAVLTLPLLVLAVFTLVGGWIGVGAFIPLVGSETPPIARWLAPATGGGDHGLQASTAAALAGASLLVSIAGMALAWAVFVRTPALAERISRKFGWIGRARAKRFWVDDVYAVFPVGFVVRLAHWAVAFDERGIDRAVHGAAAATSHGARLARRLDHHVVDRTVRVLSAIVYYSSYLFNAFQTGRLQNYALVMVIGLLAFFLLVEWDAIVGIVGSISIR